MDPRERAEAVRSLFDRLSAAAPEDRERLLAAAAEAGTVPAVLAEVRRLMGFLSGAGPTAKAPGSLEALRSQREALERLVTVHPRQIGPYELEPEPIGEGGFATVYRAMQSRPVRRAVAVKLLKTGVHSKDRADRFKREQQALAVMSHPSVASVYDAGVSEHGWPYLVMEYVPGAPITRYADEKRLTLRERLELFIPVCEAVQHAHMKGIIHRDLKPSNILVAEVDGRALPKVIDFGIAKAAESVEADGDRTGAEPMTLRGQILGTPAYMSPEQADLGATDIDTRTDVYSLGVVLYELLTGLPPFDPEKLQRSPWAEMLRIVRSEEPPTPSTRVSRAAAEEAQRIAEARRVPRDQLSRALRRELEWIPLKAMRKERQERYASPRELALDCRNALDGRPLAAGPAGVRYRARKFVRRNSGWVAAGAMVTAAIVLGLAGTVWQAAVARKQRDQAERERIAKSETLRFVRQVVESAAPLRSQGRDLSLRSVTDEFERHLENSPGLPALVRAELHDTLTVFRSSNGDHAAAVRHADEALRLLRSELGEGAPETLQARQSYAVALRGAGDTEKALNQLREASERAEQRLGLRSPVTLDLRIAYASGLVEDGRAEECEAILESDRALYAGVFPSDSDSPALAVASLANAAYLRGDAARAVDLMQEALDRLEQALGTLHPQTLLARTMLAEYLAAAQRNAEAAGVARQALGESRRVFPPDHSAIPRAAFILAAAHGDPEVPENLQSAEYQEAVRTAADLSWNHNRSDAWLVIQTNEWLFRMEGRLGRSEPMLEAAERIVTCDIRHDQADDFAVPILSAADQLTAAGRRLPQLFARLNQLVRAVPDEHDGANAARQRRLQAGEAAGEWEALEPWGEEYLEWIAATAQTGPVRRSFINGFRVTAFLRRGCPDEAAAVLDEIRADWIEADGKGQDWVRSRICERIADALDESGLPGEAGWWRAGAPLLTPGR